MAKTAPVAVKVKVRETSTGRVFEAWPVDAREMVQHPDRVYVYATDEASPATADTRSPAATPPTPPKSAAEHLAEKSYRELQELAKKAGVDASQKKDTLIEALLPHIAGGGISLEVVPKLAIDPVQFPNATPE